MAEPARRVVRTRSTKVAYITTATFGWFIYALGPCLNLLGNQLHYSPVTVSLHMTGYAFGIALGGYLTPRLSARFGRGMSLRLASLGIAVGLTLLTFGPNAYATIAATFLIGVPATTTISLNATFLDKEHGAAAAVALTESNVLAAFAGLISPLVVGLLVGLGYGWRPAVWAAAIAFLLIEWQRGPLDHFDTSQEVAATHAAHNAKLPANFWWAWGLLVAAVGSEFILVLWSGPLLADRAGLGEAATAASLATFTGGLTVGRAFISRLAARFDPEILLRWTFGVPLVAFWGLWLSTNSLVMFASLFTCGLAMSAHWPLGVTRLVRAGRANPDAAAAKTGFSSGGSTAVLPLMLGAAAQQVGIHLAFLLLPVVLAAGLALLFFKPYPAD